MSSRAENMLSRRMEEAKRSTGEQKKAQVTAALNCLQDAADLWRTHCCEMMVDTQKVMAVQDNMPSEAVAIMNRK
eukprot:CAMPEP_0180483792 /NCGR_PEP_ID=MMETSP1036_2-20121128/35607_1 /TAXON_ID=632150 /ORGANISM="Azadinium spinosum, Strain 3D9" /LENGTH=74 /DNA_ID=CAMNT_0022491615 /DNA_START=66 /DNA_END=290 /DNA_ORIENTATION=-